MSPTCSNVASPMVLLPLVGCSCAVARNGASGAVWQAASRTAAAAAGEEEEERREEEERQERVAIGLETEDGRIGPLAYYEKLMGAARPCLSFATPEAVARHLPVRGDLGRKHREIQQLREWLDGLKVALPEPPDDEAVEERAVEGSDA